MVGCAEVAVSAPSVLLDCVRRFFRPERALQLPAGLDLTELLTLADKHAVTPLVCWTLNDSFAPMMRERLRETAHFNLTLSGELLRLLDLLEEEQIEAIPLKGPALSQVLYRNLALRSFSDLDVLIRPGDLMRVKRLLEAHGYSLSSTLHWPVDSACLRSRESQLSFARDPVTVDVHWRILPEYFPAVFDTEEIWKNLRRVPFAGGTVAMLSPEHLLLFLSAHGAKHLWERLGWTCDLARLLQVEKNVDWQYVISEARETNTLRIPSLGLLLASDLLESDPPPAVVEYIAKDSTVHELAAQVRRRFLDDVPLPATALEAAGFSVRAFQSTRYRMRYLLGSFVVPSEAEYRALKIPPVLYKLYYLFRPLRLGVKYLVRLMAFA